MSQNEDSKKPDQQSPAEGPTPLASAEPVKPEVALPLDLSVSAESAKRMAQLEDSAEAEGIVVDYTAGSSLPPEGPHCYFLSRRKEMEECILVSETPYKRTVYMLEGENKGKTIQVHPDGVSWGRFYPRLFKTENKPNIFEFRGRVLVHRNEPHALVPALDNGYKFQPFLSHIIDSINSNENVLLTGGTGVGKTTHIEQLAARCNIPLLRVNFNGETRMSDFVGKNLVINGETIWVDGILPLAMKMGYWLLLDEIDFADPAVLSLLHPVLETNPCLVIKENKGEVIRPHVNFRIFATANSIGAMQDKANSFSGTNHMNDAFLDRFQVMLVPNLSQRDEIRIIRMKVGGLKSRWAKKIVEFAHRIRERQMDGHDFSSDTFSTRRILSWAKKTALLRSPIEGAKLAWLDKLPESEHEAMIKFLELQFGTRSKQKRERKEKATPSMSLAVGSGASDAPKKRGRPKGSKNKPTPVV
jgi:MoxR-like ATPase